MKKREYPKQQMAWQGGAGQPGYGQQQAGYQAPQGYAPAQQPYGQQYPPQPHSQQPQAYGQQPQGYPPHPSYPSQPQQAAYPPPAGVVSTPPPTNVAASTPPPANVAASTPPPANVAASTPPPAAAPAPAVSQELAAPRAFQPQIVTLRANEHIPSAVGQSSVPSAPPPSSSPFGGPSQIAPPSNVDVSTLKPSIDPTSKKRAYPVAPSPAPAASTPYASPFGGPAPVSVPMQQSPVSVPMHQSPVSVPLQQSHGYSQPASVPPPSAEQAYAQSQAYPQQPHAQQQPQQPYANQAPPASQYGAQPQYAQQPQYGSSGFSRWTPSESAQCPDKFMTMTTSAAPSSDKLLAQSGLPFGAIVCPLASTDEKIPVVNFGESGIVRCRRCRTYINPFAQFIESGKRWKCNCCGYLNDVPHDYYCMVGQDGRRYDEAEHPELTKGCVEFVAPSEYMQRPPQAPSYFFLIDVSYTAINTGLLHSVVQAIKKAITEHEFDSRTKMGFIAFDHQLHFFNLRASLSKPQMLVVPDINVYSESSFAPIPDDLYVNLADSKHVILSLLDMLPAMFASTKNVESAMGSALKAASSLVKNVGGKLLVFSSTLPSTGVGMLKNRQATVTADKETQALNVGDQWYQKLGLEHSKYQTSVDMYLYTPKHIDAATLGILPRVTGGQLYLYSLDGKDATQGGRRLYEDLFHDLTRETGFESVLRVRCSKGVKVREHFGNFFVRTNDLLALPNIDSDKAIGVHLEISDPKELSEALQKGESYITIQAALLYTTSSGERRIRSLTKCIQITSQLSDIYQKTNLNACMNLFGKIAIEKGLSSTLGEARQAVMNKCIDVLTKYQKSFSSKNSSQLMCPDSLREFPLHTLALIKNTALRSGAEISLDERTAAIHALRSAPIPLSNKIVYPTMYALGALLPESGTKDADGNVIMPPKVELSSEKIDRRGIFLLDTGRDILMWVGRSAHPDLLRCLFNISSFDEVDVNNSQLQLVPFENDYSTRVNAVVDQVRASAPYYRPLVAMKEGDRAEQLFFSHFIHDRMRGNHSYPEFLRELQTVVMRNAWGH